MQISFEINFPQQDELSLTLYDDMFSGTDYGEKDCVSVSMSNDIDSSNDEEEKYSELLLFTAMTLRQLVNLNGRPSAEQLSKFLLTRL